MRQHTHTDIPRGVCGAGRSYVVLCCVLMGASICCYFLETDHQYFDAVSLFFFYHRCMCNNSQSSVALSFIQKIRDLARSTFNTSYGVFFILRALLAVA